MTPECSRVLPLPFRCQLRVYADDQHVSEMFRCALPSDALLARPVTTGWHIPPLGAKVLNQAREDLHHGLSIPR
jgi:hypothetical protein